MKTLLINSHPDFNGKERFSNKLQKLFFEKFNEKFDKNELTIINLYDMDVPKIEMNGLLGIWEKQMNGEELLENEKMIIEKSQKILSQFKEHHRIVITTPLHNFNITSKLKDYIDNILLPNETFKYTETGSVGLMTDNYKILLLQASGSIFTNNDRYTPMEFTHYYLKSLFEEFMGFDKFYIVRAEGTPLLPADEILNSAKNDLDTVFNDFYSTENK